VAWMGENRNANRVLVGNLEGRIPLRKSRCKGENNIKMFLTLSHQGERLWIDFTWLEMGTRGCNKHSGVQKAGCASYLSDCQLVKMSCAVGGK